MKRKMFRSLFGLGMLALSLATILLSILFYNIWKEDFRQSLVNEVQTMAAVSNDEGAMAGKAKIIPLLGKISEYNGDALRITWIDAQGAVLYDSNSNPAQMENHLQRPEIQQALSIGHGSSMRDSATLHETNYYEALRLVDGSVLRVAKVGGNIYRVIFASLPGIIILFLFMTVGCYFAAKRITSAMIEPVEEAVAGWSNGGSEQTNVVALSREYEEIGPLIAQLDTQKEKIDKSIKDIEKERNTLRFMMEEMQEGILLAENDGSILAYNRTIKDFFHISEDQNLRGKMLYDLSHDSQWIRQIKEAIIDGQSGSYLYEIDNRHYQLTVYVTETGSGQGRILVIGSDITEDYMLQQRRHEFTSNVSHELKTPLTTISGYAEILANELVDKKSDVKLLGGRIHEAAKHMLELIESIMRLSRLEENSGEIDFTSCTVGDLASSAWKQLEAKWKNKLVSCSITGGDVSLYGNEKLLFEVFANLLDNAVKFSSKEENRIQVMASEVGNNTVVTISDTGVGISEEKKNRIFERFYQADESRGRHEGSGIGLSLVKHILEIHHGSITVDSKLGQGTKFTIKLPKERTTEEA